MKKWLILSLVLALWGGYEPPGVSQDLLSKSISRTDQIVQLVIFGFILLVITANFIKRAGRSLPVFPRLLRHGFSVHLLLFYLIAFSSSFASLYPYYSLFRAAQYLIVLFLIAYLIDELPDQGAIIRVLFIFSLVNLIYVAVGLVLFPHVVMGGAHRLAGGGFFRADGGSVPFNVSIFSLCYYFTSRRHSHKTASVIIFLTAIVLLVLYQDRNIMYQAPLYYLFIILYYRRFSIKAFIGITVVLSVLAGIVLAGFPLYERFTERGVKSETRMATWEIVLKRRGEVPLYGFGFLGTPAYLLRVQKSMEGRGIGITADPHNYFLTAFTDLGVFGLLYSVVIFFLILRLVRKRFKQRAAIPHDTLLPGVIAVVLQSTISAFVTNFLIAPITSTTISTIICLMLLDSALPPQKAQPRFRTAGIKRNQYSFQGLSSPR